MALRGVNGNFASYEALRKITIPLDTEPAFSFHPALPGKKFNRTRKPTPKVRARVEVPKYGVIEDVAFFSATQLGELIRTRKITSVDLTKMYIARLKHYGPKLNCTVTPTDDLALTLAAQADQELKNGKYRGPLHGIPWGAKDLFATKGILTTWGAEPFKNQMIDYDSTVVERLRDAGAVLIAKLSMGALAQGGLWFGGMTKNPWNTEQTSSGSSAGPASATSAGLVGFSIGTETLGSIMSPSSTCGVVGLRPTYGRVSRYGAMGLDWTMDKIGPICRSVEDCASALEAIYGPDDRDITVGDVPFNWPNDTPLSKMRISYIQSEFEPQPNPQRQLTEQQQQMMQTRRGIFKDALDVLRKAEPISSRLLCRHFRQMEYDSCWKQKRPRRLMISRAMVRLINCPGNRRTIAPNSFRTSRFIPAVEYIRAQRARTLLMREMDKMMSQCDVFVSPAPNSASLTITNLTGHPAVCTPCGFVNNLPLSIMFTGGIYDEAAPLRVALAFEQSTNWHTMHPKVDW